MFGWGNDAGGLPEHPPPIIPPWLTRPSAFIKRIQGKYIYKGYLGGRPVGKTGGSLSLAHVTQGPEECIMCAGGGGGGGGGVAEMKV